MYPPLYKISQHQRHTRSQTTPPPLFSTHLWQTQPAIFFTVLTTTHFVQSPLTFYKTARNPLFDQHPKMTKNTEEVSDEFCCKSYIPTKIDRTNTQGEGLVEICVPEAGFVVSESPFTVLGTILIGLVTLTLVAAWTRTDRSTKTTSAPR